jgi:polyisoprenoid-binding protein YceI
MVLEAHKAASSVAARSSSQGAISMNRHILAGAGAALVLAVASQGLAQQVSSSSPTSVKAGSYKVEPYHTQVAFTLSHFGFSNFSGFFSGASGSLRLDPAHLGATSLDVTIPVASVTTTVAALDSELKGNQWFDAARFPTASFTSTKVTPTGAGRAAIAGNLTLHGVTRPVVLQARFVGAGTNPLDKAETVGFSATGTIKRSDFGVKQYVPLVGDDVQLSIAGAFTRQS